MRAPTYCVFVTALSFGCAHSGSGQGELRGPETATAGQEQPRGAVEFTWHSDSNSSHGTIDARLPDGRRFQGTYAQALSSEWSDGSASYLDDSPNLRWSASNSSYVRRPQEFAMHFAESVVAHLEAPDRARMRCVFTLHDPRRGLAAGGEGNCQISTREEIFDAVLRQDSRPG